MNFIKEATRLAETYQYVRETYLKNIKILVEKKFSTATKNDKKVIIRDILCMLSCDKAALEEMKKGIQPPRITTKMEDLFSERQKQIDENKKQIEENKVQIDKNKVQIDENKRQIEKELEVQRKRIDKIEKEKELRKITRELEKEFIYYPYPICVPTRCSACCHCHSDGIRSGIWGFLGVLVGACLL